MVLIFAALSNGDWLIFAVAIAGYFVSYAIHISFSGIWSTVIQLYLNIILMMVVAINMIDNESPFVILISWLIAGAWALFYAGASSVCIVKGIFVRYYQWPMVQVGAVYTLLVGAVDKKNIKATISICFTTIILLGALFLMERFELVADDITTFAITGIGGALMLWWTGLAVRNFVSDRLTLQRLQATSSATWVPEDMVGIFRSLRSVSGSVRFLRMLAQRSFDGDCGAWASALREMIATAHESDTRSEAVKKRRRLRFRGSPVQQMIDNDKISTRRDLLFALLERITRAERALAI